MLYCVRFSLKAMMLFARAVVPKSGIFTCSLQMTSVVETDVIKSSKSSRITKTLSRFLLSLKIPSSFHHCRSGLLYRQFFCMAVAAGAFYGKNYEVLHGDWWVLQLLLLLIARKAAYRYTGPCRLSVIGRNRRRGCGGFRFANVSVGEASSFVLEHAFVFESRRPASCWPCSQVVLMGVAVSTRI